MAKKEESKKPTNKGIKKAEPAKKVQAKVEPKKAVKEPTKKLAKATPKKTVKELPKKVTKTVEKAVKEATKKAPKKTIKEARNNNNGLLYDVNETPPIGKWIVLAIQHVFAMLSATILVPIMVNGLCGKEIIPISLAFIASGIGTIIYIFCTQRKSPVYLGGSIAFIAPMIMGYGLAGISGLFTGLVVTGLLYIVVALAMMFWGREWLNKALPPVVVGPMIIIIGLGLAGLAVDYAGIGLGIFEWENLVVLLVTLAVTIGLAMYTKGFFKIVPFIFGIVAGYITACLFGMVDFQPVLDAKWLGLPEFNFIFADWNLHFGAVLTIAPVALITIANHINNHIELGNLLREDLTTEPGLERTLIGEGIATAISAMAGGPAVTAQSDNNSVVGKTKIASITAVGLAALIVIIIAFIGKLIALVETIPNPVLGGIAILVFGFVVVSGIKILVKNQVDFERTKNVVVVATMLIIAIGGAYISTDIGDYNLAIGGMSLAVIVGILLNLLLPNKESEMS